MKYIVIQVETKLGKTEYPVIFPNAFIHADVAEAITSLVTKSGDDLLVGATPVSAVSAGDFSSLTLAGIKPGGKSTTLGIEARPARDMEVIIMNDYGAGYVD